MDKEFLERVDRLRSRFGGKHAALRRALSLSIMARGEEVSEAAVAAEALKFNERAFVAYGVYMHMLLRPRVLTTWMQSLFESMFVKAKLSRTQLTRVLNTPTGCSSMGNVFGVFAQRR